MKITREFTFTATNNIYITTPFNAIAKYLNERGWEIESYEISKREPTQHFSSAKFICNKNVEENNNVKIIDGHIKYEGYKDERKYNFIIVIDEDFNIIILED